MQQATFTISGSELTQEFLETIQLMFKGKKSQDIEIFIRVKAKETSTEAKQRIEQSIENLEKGENLISFSSSDYDSLVKGMSEK